MFLKIPYSAYVYALIATIFSVILFFYTSFFAQVNQILSLNLSISITLNSFFILASDGLHAMGFLSATLLIVWVLAIFIFYATFFGLIIIKRKYAPKEIKLKKSRHSVVGILSFALSWLSFGCIACGQAILTSIVAIFVTQLSVGLMHNIVFFVLLISIIMLLFTAYGNYKLLKNPNICPII